MLLHKLGHVVGVTALPLLFSLRAFEPPTFDQLACSGCTAHAGASAIVIAQRAVGLDEPIVPSPRFGYALDRMVGMPGQPLQDNGAELADFCTAVTRFGVVPIGPLNPNGNTDITTGDDGNVNVKPSLEDLIGASHRLIVGEYRVDLTDPDMGDVVCGLLVKGVPLYVGGFVDSAFESYTVGSGPVGAPDFADPSGGGHAMVIVGFATRPDGSRIFEVLSSWSDAFGDDGHAWVTEDWVRALWDAYAFNVREVDS